MGLMRKRVGSGSSEVHPHHIGGLVSTRLPWECVRCRVGSVMVEMNKSRSVVVDMKSLVSTGIWRIKTLYNHACS
jgi:hypothetical protein